MLNNLIRAGGRTSADSVSQLSRDKFSKKAVIAAKAGKFVALDYKKNFAFQASSYKMSIL